MNIFKGDSGIEEPSWMPVNLPCSSFVSSIERKNLLPLEYHPSLYEKDRVQNCLLVNENGESEHLSFNSFTNDYSKHCHDYRLSNQVFLPFPFPGIRQ